MGDWSVLSNWPTGSIISVALQLFSFNSHEPIQIDPSRDVVLPEFTQSQIFYGSFLIRLSALRQSGRRLPRWLTSAFVPTIAS